ncbi:MAG: hypothetical protein A3E00_15255 [Curvibacter sp. RIFCSPHIGHO2_12_FULL_63_18]|uniref:hypothetical protein n=1 Tax=Rhodoferax sp. TaxID=50421 RepID=UPI0008B457D3|nr:hypothetical protein [Rhodoferax sp.]OGO98210.1 MAG: hypothetical protein A2037_06330 [Curvibacter sp. GWA2_63_95]OGP02743.1 MAG: hypothetical protein A3E00_15255 [Curvibacter sp. RIFCSPHIGHO2_12_FULL_63_18]HCX81528.1 hypothetical protein [Rhodoferax sp.]
MIGILFFIGFGLWLIAAIMLSAKIPRWLGMSKHTTAASWLLFPLLLVAPIADELIGRWQFNRLCEREAVATLSPDWEKVRRATHREIPTVELDGYFIPIRLQREEYFDRDSGKTFISKLAFHTKGGFLMRHGLGLDGTTSCWPPKHESIYREINLEQLLKEY